MPTDTDLMSYLLATQRLLLIVLALYVYVAFCLMVIARKNGTAHSWLAWIPVANLYLMCRIARRSGWWLLLLLIPIVNVIVAVVIWWGIARARGKSGWLGALMLVPVVNLLVLMYLATGPASAPPAGTAQPAASPGVPTPTVCTACAAPLEPGARYCGECGAVAATVPAPAPTPAAPPARESRSRFATAAVVVLLLAVGAGGAYMLLGGARVAGPREAPAMPAPMAGTLIEFPIDTAADAPARPDAVAAQRLTLGRAPNVPAQWLPPDIPPAALAGADAVTAATYRAHPEDPPVSVTVLTASSGDANAMVTDLARRAQADRATDAPVGVRVQSPAGVAYSGVRFGDDRGGTTYVFAKAIGFVVIVLYAPDPTVAPLAARLAANLGNGGGLIAEAAMQDAIWCLPPRPPSDLELVETQIVPTSRIAEAGAELDAMAELLGPESRPWVARVHRMLPRQLMTATYVDRGDRAWNVMRGEYGSNAAALAAWAVVRMIVAFTSSEALSVPAGDGRLGTLEEQPFAVLRNGSSLVLLTAPAGETPERLHELAGAIQP